MAKEIKVTKTAGSKASKTLSAPSKLKVLFVIVNRNKVDFMQANLEQYKINAQVLAYAHGTAPRDIDKITGIAMRTQKAILMAAISEDIVKDVLANIREKYLKARGVKGVAFTVPMSSIVGVSAYKFLIDSRE